MYTGRRPFVSASGAHNIGASRDRKKTFQPYTSVLRHRCLIGRVLTDALENEVDRDRQVHQRDGYSKIL